MATITSGVATVFKPTIWSKEVTKSFDIEKVMAKLVSRFDAEVKESGDTVKIPNLSSITATYKLEGSAVAETATTETTTSLSINKWAVARVTVEDIVKIQSQYPLMQYYAEKLGAAVAHLQDDDIMALYTSFSSTVGATSNNVGLAWSFILGGIRILDAAYVPGTDRSLTVDAYGLEDLRNMDQFVRYDATGRAGRYEDGKKSTSSEGKIFGVNVYLTNNTPVTTSLVTGLLFHKEAIALAEQKSVRVQDDYSARTLDTAIIADLLYGVAARRTGAAVRVQYGQ